MPGTIEVHKPMSSCNTGESIKTDISKYLWLLAQEILRVHLITIYYHVKIYCSKHSHPLVISSIGFEFARGSLAILSMPTDSQKYDEQCL